MDKILNKIRGASGIGDNSVRTFKVPEVNWEADTIKELIKWDETPLTEPSITASLSSEDIRNCLDSPLALPQWPCHGQSVERTVKKVSEASLHVFGQFKRDGWIRASDDSRKKLPTMETKRDYKSLLTK